MPEKPDLPMYVAVVSKNPLMKVYVYQNPLTFEVRTTRDASGVSHEESRGWVQGGWNLVIVRGDEEELDRKVSEDSFQKIIAYLDVYDDLPRNLGWIDKYTGKTVDLFGLQY